MRIVCELLRGKFLHPSKTFYPLPDIHIRKAGCDGRDRPVQTVQIEL